MKTKTLLYTFLFLLITACASTSNDSYQKMSDAIQLMHHAKDLAKGNRDLTNVSKADNLIKQAQENINAGDTTQADLLLDESINLSQQVIDNAYMGPVGAAGTGKW